MKTLLIYLYQITVSKKVVFGLSVFGNMNPEGVTWKDVY